MNTVVRRPQFPVVVTTLMITCAFIAACDTPRPHPNPAPVQKQATGYGLHPGPIDVERRLIVEPSWRGKVEFNATQLQIVDANFDSVSRGVGLAVGSVQACYHQVVAGHPEVGGKAEFRITIGPTIGRHTKPLSIEVLNTVDDGIRACIEDGLGHAVFMNLIRGPRPEVRGTLTFLPNAVSP